MQQRRHTKALAKGPTCMAGLVAAGLFLVGLLPARGQQYVQSVAHPGGLMVLEVEDPVIFVWREVSGSTVTTYFWQRPAGRFRLLTGAAQPTGGDPTRIGDEDRAVASTETLDRNPNDTPFSTFSSKLTVAVGGDHETGNYHDLHAIAAAVDETTDQVWDFWPVPPRPGSRDIVGEGRIPLDDEDPNVAKQFIYVQHIFTLIHDVLKIEYIVTNRANRTLPIGIRVFIDGQFGGARSLDGSIILLPGGRVITSEAVLPDAKTPTLPDTWVTLDRPDNPTVILRGTITGAEVNDKGVANESAGKPDLIGWGLARNAGRDAQWDFTPNQVLGLEGEDWGYFVRWNPRDLPAGRSRRYVTYFGMGASTANYDPPYALAAYAPTSLVATAGDDPSTPEVERYYLTDRQGQSPFPVYCYADNFYPSPLLDASVRISLPAGLELDPDTQPRSRSFGTIRRNEVKSVSWTVRATAARPGVAVVKFAGPLGKTLERRIYIPAVPILTPLPSSERGLEMIAIPYAFDDTDAEHVLQSLGPLHPGENMLIRYDPSVGEYKSFPDPFVTSIEPGAGYWLLNRNRKTAYLPSDAREVPTDRAYSVNVLRGWNQVGNPFTAPVNLSDVRVVAPTGAELSMQEAVSRGMILPTLFWFDPVEEEYRWKTELSAVRMDPYTGYWLYADKDLTLQVPPPSLYAPASAGTPQTAAQVERAPGDWRVELTVAGAGRVRSQRCFGVSSSASDGLDPQDVLAPPPCLTTGPSVTAEFTGLRDGTRYMQDIRPPASGALEWNLVVTTSAANEPMRVTWPDLSSLPAHLALVLEDTKTGERRYMRTTTSYRFISGMPGEPRTLRIRVQPRGSRSALVTTASVHPTASGVAITYTLSNDAAVEGVVMNISGVPIRQLTAGRLAPAGVNTLVWDGRNGQGSLVPPGRYLCRITARSPETGEQHSIVRAFQLAR